MNIKKDESTAAAASGDEYGCVVQSALDGVTVITSNRHAARELLLACEREIHRTAAASAWKTPQVLPWNGWIARLWNEHNLFAKKTLALLNDDQEVAIWRRLLSESRQRGFLDLDGAAALCRQAWALLHEYHIPLERRAFQASAETRLFFECAEKYSKLTEKNLWMESARLHDQLSAGLEPSFLPRQVILFGFDELTPQQSAFCERLSKCGIHIHPVKGAVKQSVGPVKIAMPSVEDELRAAAGWARDKLEQNPQARIGIIVPQLQQLRRETEQVLRQTFYPAGHLPRTPAYHLSLGPPLPEYPLIRTALAILRWWAGALPVAEVSYLLRSPYVGGADEEVQRRAMLEVELRGWRPSLTVKQAAVWMEKSVAGSTCPVLARVLSESRQMSEGLAGRKQRPGAWAEIFSQLLKTWGWPGDDPRSEEYQAAEKFREVFARFASLDAVIPELDVSDAVVEVARMAEGTLFQVENQGAAVHVLGPLEAAGSCFDHLWISGSSDAVWPLRGQLNPLLPFALQRQHGVPYSSPERQQTFSRQVFNRLLASGAEAVCSWAENHGDEVLDPCPWLAALPHADEMQLLELNQAPARWAERQRAQAELEEWVDERAPSLAPGKHKGGTRLLELQSACPFRATSELRLGAKPLEEASLGIDPR
jgi:probable DNA repair protein